MIRIPNGKIACEPINSSIEMERKSATAFIKNKTQLLAAKVVYPSADPDKHGWYVPGDTVYLRGDCITLPWVKEPFDIGGEKVILVPCDQIQAWDYSHRVKE